MTEFKSKRHLKGGNILINTASNEQLVGLILTRSAEKTFSHIPLWKFGHGKRPKRVTRILTGQIFLLMQTCPNYPNNVKWSVLLQVKRDPILRSPIPPPHPFTITANCTFSYSVMIFNSLYEKGPYDFLFPSCNTFCIVIKCFHQQPSATTSGHTVTNMSTNREIPAKQTPSSNTDVKRAADFVEVNK